MGELPKSAIVLKLEAMDDGSRKITIDNWKYGEII